MESSSSLSFLLTLPLIGAVLSFVVPKPSQRPYAIFASVLFLALSIYETAGILFCKTLEDARALAVEHRLAWIPELGLGLSLRLDSVSAWFVVMNALTAVIAFSTRGTWYRKSPGLFTGLGFFLVFALNAAFLSHDLIAFYLAYEAVFIPVFFMMGIWGTRQKAASVFGFFLMSLLGSVLMLVSIFYLMNLTVSAGGASGSYLPDLLRAASLLDADRSRWVFAGFFLAFAIKVPLVPFHGWLRDGYTSAPMPATIWMSAILSKLGVFGMIRFGMPLFQSVVIRYQGLLLAIAAVSVVYAALLAIRSSRPKTLLAYSSISHLGFVMMGVFSGKLSGTGGAVLLSAGHSVVSGLLFFLLGEIEERREDLSLMTPSGLAHAFPRLATVLFGAVLAGVSLPGTMNFAGEFVVLLSVFPVSAVWTAVAGLGVVLGAVYLLRFYQQLCLGERSTADGTQASTGDLGGFALVLSFFLLGVVVLGGFQTAVFLKGN
jgi:NADH-quinone oxidoreductase subunit M